MIPDPKLVEAAAQALKDSRRYSVEGTPKSQSGYGPPYEAPWFVIDTSSAEPEVNWPGELCGEFQDRREAAKERDRLASLFILTAVTPLIRKATLEEEGRQPPTAAQIEAGARAALIALANYHEQPQYTEEHWQTVPAADCFIDGMPAELLIKEILAVATPLIRKAVIEEAAKAMEAHAPFQVSSQLAQRIRGLILSQ